MNWTEALSLLQDNHTAVAISVSPEGRAQATVVSSAVFDGKVAFASRGRTVKVKNIERTARAAVTVIRLDNRRYVTVEGPASIEAFNESPAYLKRLKDFYTAMGRGPKGTDGQFARKMREEQRTLVLVTPERIYGSLRSGA